VLRDSRVPVLLVRRVSERLRRPLHAELSIGTTAVGTLVELHDSAVPRPVPAPLVM